MKNIVIYALTIYLIYGPCSEQANTTVPVSGTMLKDDINAAIKTFANTVNAFAFKVLAQLLLQVKKQITQPPLQALNFSQTTDNASIYQKSLLANIVYSPTSLVSVLSLLYLGSAGTTHDQIGAILNPENLTSDEFHKKFSGYLSGFSIPKNPQNTLVLAKRLLVDAKHINPKYVNDSERYYEAGVEKCDFENNAETIAQDTNSWVRKQSGGLIENIIKPEEMSPLTKLIVLDAILFKGVWAQTFNKSLTEQEPFYITPQMVKNKTMMIVKGLFKCFYLLEESFKMMGIEIPFVGLDASLYVLLPEKWEYQNLTGFVQSMTIEKLAQTMRMLPGYETTLKLPKFKTSQNINFKPILQSIGLKGMFDPQKADFSPITANFTQPLHVTDFKQRAVIDLNEEDGSASSVLAVGDLLVELNRESTKNRSYLSLKFAIKQATYTGRLIVKILRSPFAKYINEQCNSESLYNQCPSPITSSRVSVCDTIESDRTKNDKPKQFITSKKGGNKKSVMSKAYLYEESRRKEKMEDAQNAFLEWKTRRKSKMHTTDNIYDFSSNASSMFNLSEISQDTPYMDYKDTLAMKPNKNTLIVENPESPIAPKLDQTLYINSDSMGQKHVKSRADTFNNIKMLTSEKYLLDKRLSPPLVPNNRHSNITISPTTTPTREIFHDFLDSENYGDKDKQISDKISESSDSGLSFATADAHESSSYSLSADITSSLNLSSTFDSILAEKDLTGTLTPCGAESPKSAELRSPVSISNRADIPIFTFPKIKQIIPSFEGYKSNLPSLFQLEQKILQSKTPKQEIFLDNSKTSLEAKIEALQTHSPLLKYIAKHTNGSIIEAKEDKEEMQSELIKEIEDSQNEKKKNVHEKLIEEEITETTENMFEELKIINMTLSSNDEDNSDENEEISSQCSQTPLNVVTETIQEPKPPKDSDLKPELENCIDGNNWPKIEIDSQKGKRLIHPIKLVKFEFALKPTVQCQGCGKDLIDDQALICVKDLNYHYHLGCFKCSICDYSAGNRFKNILSSSYSDDLEIDLPPVKIHNNLINCISCD